MGWSIEGHRIYPTLCEKKKKRNSDQRTPRIIKGLLHLGITQKERRFRKKLLRFLRSKCFFVIFEVEIGCAFFVLYHYGTSAPYIWFFALLLSCGAELCCGTFLYVSRRSRIAPSAAVSVRRLSALRVTVRLSRTKSIHASSARRCSVTAA